jgi:hypothetical protein
MRTVIKFLFVFATLLISSKSGGQVLVNPYSYDGLMAHLSGVLFHHRTDGLVVNTTNAVGTVDASGNVTTITSVAPFNTGRQFTSLGTAPTLNSGYVTIGSAGNFRTSSLKSVYNVMHYNGSADASLITWAVHGVFRFQDNNAITGIFGNNGTGSANKGVSAYLNNLTASASRQLNGQITKGAASSFISEIRNSNIIPLNEWVYLWIQVEKDQAQAEEWKIFVNGSPYIVANRQQTNAAVDVSTYDMEIGATGNATNRNGFDYKEITIQTGIHTDAFIQEYSGERMGYYGISPIPSSYDDVETETVISEINTVDDGRYYLSTHLCVKPSDPNTIVAIFDDGTGHVSFTDRKASYRKSTDKGLTWTTRAVAFDNGSTDVEIDVSAGYDASDRLHIVSGTQAGPGGTNKLWHTYSDDDGATWSTPVEITSALPADGLSVWRTYSKIIENNGRLMLAMYKQNSGATSSANYLLYSDDGGTTWATKTIRAAAATYINESDIVALSSTFLLVVSRNEATKEWNQFVSTDNGDTWTNQGALDWGEVIASQPGPLRLSLIDINGTDVVEAAYIDRDVDYVKLVYGKASSIISSGVSGWTARTKHTIYQGGYYDSSEGHLHYGGIAHPDGNMNGIGMYAQDHYPGSGGTENKQLTFSLPTGHYPYVKSLLGL